MRGAFADGQQVAAARITRGLTQDQLAVRAGLDVKTVRKAEQGKRLDLATLSRIAAALDMELGRLVRDARLDTDLQRGRRETVLAWQQAWDAQDIDAILCTFHDDAMISMPGGPTLPFGGTFHGRDGIRRCHEAAWAASRTEPVPAGDFSLVESGDVFLLEGVKGIVLPNGEVVRLRCMQLFTFRDERVINLRVEFDTLAFNRLLGRPSIG